MKMTHPMIDQDISRPKQLELMLEISKVLSEGIPFVRVDLFNFKNKIYFGEMTLTPFGGFQIITPPEYDFILGWELVLP